MVFLRMNHLIFIFVVFMNILCSCSVFQPVDDLGESSFTATPSTSTGNGQSIVDETMGNEELEDEKLFDGEEEFLPVISPVFTAVATPIRGTPTPVFFEGPIVYGFSYEQRPLEAYRIGTGASARAIIGGIHGGYEWNTVELVNDMLTYFRENPDLISPDTTLYIITCANPDGYAAGTSPEIARMDGNGVDLNRNWDYQWQMTATHGMRVVSAGSYPFSEPETAALRDFILLNDVELVIFYHSAMGVVFSGADRISSVTYDLAEMLSGVTGYPHQSEGVPGQITTGDSIDWLSTQGIAAAEIELSTHQLIGEDEWQKNLSGVLAFLNWSIPEPMSETGQE